MKRYRIEERPETARLKASDIRGERDFLTSTHERFRPVAMTSGPDGTLYIADMYRGLIQHRIFLTTFLRVGCGFEPTSLRYHRHASGRCSSS